MTNPSELLSITHSQLHYKKSLGRTMAHQGTHYAKERKSNSAKHFQASSPLPRFTQPSTCHIYNKCLSNNSQDDPVLLYFIISDGSRSTIH